MAVEVVTLAEFLDARIADDLRRDQERLITSFMDTGATATQIEERLRGTTAWAHIGIRHGMRRIGVAAASSFPRMNGAWLRKQATAYSSHPDYQEAWRP